MQHALRLAIYIHKRIYLLHHIWREAEPTTIIRLSNKALNPFSDEKEEPDDSKDGLLEKLAKTRELDDFWPQDPFKELEPVRLCQVKESYQ